MIKVREGVLDILNNKFDIEEKYFKSGDHLKNDLGLDSLDVIELEMECESKFKIKIDNDQSSEIYTLSDLVKFVEDHIK